MTPRGYPVPFVKHSVSTGQLPQHHPQPPIVMDYQRLVEHMKADFHSELQTFKAELLSAVRAELQAFVQVAPVSNVSGATLEQIERTLKRVLDEMGPRESRTVDRTQPQKDQPLYVPSDLLAPMEGSVAVSKVSESAGNMDEASSTLRKVLRNSRGKQ